MGEKKKMGLDIARSSTLVQPYQVMSWERNPIPKDQELDAIQSQIDAEPERAELYMKKGHRLAVLGYYREAGECYSQAITYDPFNWEFYRHRAHRFLSCGLFADAAADFTMASRLNPKDWNVWYHLGLSYFLLGMYEKADWAYTRCAALNKTKEELVAVADWRYMTLMRLGQKEEAQQLLDTIEPDLEITDIASAAYYKRLLLYKGLISPEELFENVDPKAGAGLGVITQGFGLANYYLFRGETQKYEELLEQVIETSANSRWYSAFACLAAHADQQRNTK
ncbi:MAG: tetratricopeptide repeat protein [Lachnospiraceae bacterium]|nr:tetratricopeptide repeat protein [Lachnospiraceae bacterium]